MAAFATTRTAAIYVTDGGSSVPHDPETGYFTQAALGWVAPTGLTPPKPGRGIRYRAALCVTAAGARRRVVVATAAAYDALTPLSSTINVNVGGQSVVAQVYRLEGERTRGIRVPSYAG